MPEDLKRRKELVPMWSEFFLLRVDHFSEAGFDVTESKQEVTKVVPC